MIKNKIEICECGHNRCEHIPICCADEECKCKKYKRKLEEIILDSNDTLTINWLLPHELIFKEMIEND